MHAAHKPIYRPMSMAVLDLYSPTAPLSCLLSARSTTRLRLISISLLPEINFLRLTSSSTPAPARLGWKIMFISRFYRLGGHAIKNLVKAPSVTRRTSYFPEIHNQYVGAQRHILYSTTADKLDSGDENETNEKINVTFVDKDGEETHIEVPAGMSMLEAAHENELELEGACEGSLACSTCHVIVMDMEQYNKLPDPSDEENDMLDLAFGLTETSRLGCQIIAKPELEGLRLAIPSATRNFAVDGYKPKPH